MNPTERETSSQFKTSNRFTLQTKEVTLKHDGYFHNPEPVIQHLSLYNNCNIGNTTVSSNGAAVTRLANGNWGDKDYEANTSTSVLRDKLTVRSENSNDLTRNGASGNYVLIFILGCILIFGCLCTGLLLSGIVSLNFPPSEFNQNHTDGSETTTQDDINLSRQEMISSESLIKPRLPSSNMFLVEINHMLDLFTLSNKTTKVVIKSTNDTGISNNDLISLETLKPPVGHMTVTVINDAHGKDLDNFRDVLKWLSNSTVNLEIDGNISILNCNSTLPVYPSFLQNDIMTFSNLKTFGIHNLNVCFISEWVRHFRTPIIETITVFSVVEDVRFHPILLEIFNKSKKDYSILMCKEEEDRC